MLNLIENVRAKIEASARISDDEALALFAHDDFLAVGELAALANRRVNGEKVYFNVNRHINYTNICVNRCTFCAFSRENENEDGGYTLALNDILERAAEASAEGATEIHMVGGLHPDLPFDFYLEILAAIKADSPLYLEPDAINDWSDVMVNGSVVQRLSCYRRSGQWRAFMDQATSSDMKTAAQYNPDFALPDPATDQASDEAITLSIGLLRRFLRLRH